MKLTRKSFLKTSALIAGGAALSGNKLLASLLQDDKRLQIIRDNYGIYTEKGGSIGWYINDDALIVVDTQFTDTAKNFLDLVRKNTERKIDIVFNTHHHADHTSGNVFLREHTEKIVAHENCPVLQRKRNAKPGEEDKLVYADTTFKDNFKTDLGSEVVNAFHLIPAHTGADSVIHFEQANIVHMGDLVFHNVFPYVNLEDEAHLSGWLDYLNMVHSKFDDDTIFIFGHGQSNDIEKVTGRRKDLLVMKDYLTALLQFTQKEILKGSSEEEAAAAESIPGVSNRKQLWDGAMAMNIREAYKELNKK
jgi:glyoxylase-like metal-dependent hydrolase (beta-lactamase superfamily II)